MIRVLFVAMLACQMVFAAADANSQTTNSSNDIFSGSVTASGEGKVTVVRKVPAHADESRTFVVDQDTRVEGRLRVNARVTVRFHADEDGAVHALRVIVRADATATTGPAKRR